MTKKNGFLENSFPEAMTSAYIIANVDVTNPTQYEEYKKLSTVAMKAHGAEVCVRGGKVEVLEGDWTSRAAS